MNRGTSLAITTAAGLVMLSLWLLWPKAAPGTAAQSEARPPAAEEPADPFLRTRPAGKGQGSPAQQEARRAAQAQVSERRAAAFLDELHDTVPIDDTQRAALTDALVSEWAVADAIFDEVQSAKPSPDTQEKLTKAKAGTTARASEVLDEEQLEAYTLMRTPAPPAATP